MSAADPGPLAPRTVRIRPTRAGIATVGVALVALLLSLAVPRATVFAAASGAAALALPLLARLHARGLRMLPPRPVTAFAGEPFPLELVVLTRSAFFAARDVVFLLPGAAAERLRPAGLAPTVAPGVPATVVLSQRIAQRGRVRSLQVAVETTFPLGLARAELAFDVPCDVLVLPRVGELRSADAWTAHRHGLLYVGASDRGDEQEFDTLHEWRAGESLRRVHWRLSARRGRLLVREFRGEDRPAVHVVLDTRVPPGRGGRARATAFERAVTLAATLVEHHLRRGHACRLTVLGPAPFATARRRGRAALLPILEALADVAAAPAEGAREVAPGRRDEITLHVCVGAPPAAPGPGAFVLDATRPEVARLVSRTGVRGLRALLGGSA